MTGDESASPAFLGRGLGSHDADEAHAFPRAAAQVVGQAKGPTALGDALDLALGRAPRRRSCSQHSNSIRSPDAPIG